MVQFMKFSNNQFRTVRLQKQTIKKKAKRFAAKRRIHTQGGKITSLLPTRRLLVTITLVVYCGFLKQLCLFTPLLNLLTLRVTSM